MADEVSISIHNVSKSFGERTVLNGISLDILEGEFVAIVGKSGCGKSTLLRLVAGLDKPSSGGLDVTGRIRMMFQDARLLPWKRIRDNVALGLPQIGSSEKVNSSLNQVGLLDRAGDYPIILSGGQKQRIALARALASEPSILLFDEPLGALDALTRAEMQILLSDLWRARGFTALLVTHDIEEAILLADRVILMEEGRIAHSVSVPHGRPRHRNDPGIAGLTESLLNRILQPAILSNSVSIPAR